MQRTTPVLLTIMLMTAALSSNAKPTDADWDHACAAKVYDCFMVQGAGIHFFSSAILHETTPTPTGKIDRSTDTVELTGDIVGRILYHPVSRYDFSEATLVNTGSQVFSGSVAGHPPVLLLDDTFRFDVDLQTGETTGTIAFTRTIAGPETRCFLNAVGTGLTPDGDAKIEYSGWCRVRVEPSRQ